MIENNSVAPVGFSDLKSISSITLFVPTYIEKLQFQALIQLLNWSEIMLQSFEIFVCTDGLATALCCSKKKLLQLLYYLWL